MKNILLILTGFVVGLVTTFFIQKRYDAKAAKIDFDQPALQLVNTFDNSNIKMVAFLQKASYEINNDEIKNLVENYSIPKLSDPWKTVDTLQAINHKLILYINDLPFDVKKDFILETRND